MKNVLAILATLALVASCGSPLMTSNGTHQQSNQAPGQAAGFALKAKSSGAEENNNGAKTRPNGVGPSENASATGAEHAAKALDVANVNAGFAPSEPQGPTIPGCVPVPANHVETRTAGLYYLGTTSDVTNSMGYTATTPVNNQGELPALDGHFQLVLDLPDNTNVLSVKLTSIIERVWWTNQDYYGLGMKYWWILGAGQNCKQLNGDWPNQTTLGTYSGKTVLDLYGFDATYFPGNPMTAHVYLGDGSVITYNLTP